MQRKTSLMQDLKEYILWLQNDFEMKKGHFIQRIFTGHHHMPATGLGALDLVVTQTCVPGTSSLVSSSALFFKLLCLK